MKYSVIIVTYNRCELLKEAVECALNQSVKPSHIVIINNASDDGTYEYLKKLNKDYKGGTSLVIKTLKKNTGGAGGFYYGLKAAHQLGDDWHVIIDDDAMLELDFMYRISGAIKIYKDV
uniref:glycosyltransferase n=1 Tax=Lachnospira sp. TaxID=2049031 RepID=UPI0040289A9D